MSSRSSSNLNSYPGCGDISKCLRMNDGENLWLSRARDQGSHQEVHIVNRLPVQGNCRCVQRVAKISGTPQQQQIPDSHRLQVSRYVFNCASSENLGRPRPGARPGAPTHGVGWFCSASTRWWKTFCYALHQMSISWCFFRSRLASHILGVCLVQR